MPSRPAIEVHIRGLGFFPEPEIAAQFLVRRRAPGLAVLAADTDAATALLGIASEKRAFSPHLTLARIKERLDLAPLHQRIAREAISLDFGELPSAQPSFCIAAN